MPQNLSRRTSLTLLSALVALIGAMLAFAPVAGANTPASSTTTTRTTKTTTATTTALPASTNVAVRVFPQYTNATYGDHQASLALLGRLGIKRVSGLLTPNMSSSQIQFYQDAYNQYGIKIWFAVGQPGVQFSAADWTSIRNILEGPLKGMVVLASGWNEPNHSVSGDWASATAQHQRELWSQIQQVNSASGQNISVGTPPLWSGSLSTQYSDLQTLAPKIQGDYNTIDWHLYPHCKTGTGLTSMIDTQISKFQAAYGQHPMVDSESGYSTYASSNCNSVTETQQAQLLPTMVDDNLQRGVGVSYFELLDDVDSTGTNREAHFGLVDTPSLSSSTWTDKPSFAAMQKVLAQ